MAHISGGYSCLDLAGNGKSDPVWIGDVLNVHGN